MNGATNFVWSQLAQSNGAIPAYDPATGVCSNVYCHGAAMPGSDSSGTNRAPVWNQPFMPVTLTAAACGTCHGFPPSAVTGHPVVTIPAGFPASAAIGGTCSCHANINPAGNSYDTIFVDKTLHINGSVEFSATSTCDSCHGYPPAQPGFAGTQNAWPNAKKENYPGGGGAHTINNHVRMTATPFQGFTPCLTCHNPADHAMSPVVFLPGTNIRVTIHDSVRYEASGQARYTSNRLNGVQHQTGTCSNISCHFGATPAWDQH
jgi:predicted CxxxxCH...CXXCH cytochrome family protein